MKFIAILGVVAYCKEAVQCDFNDTQSLIRCQNSFRENAQQLCPARSWPYPDQSLSAKELHPSHSVDFVAWKRLQDQDVKNVVHQFLVTEGSGDFRVQDLLAFDYASVCIALGVVVLLLAWGFFLPMTCCCASSYRPRSACSAGLVLPLALVGGVGILVLCSIGVSTIRKTGEVQAAIKCYLPGTVYGMSALELKDVFSAAKVNTSTVNTDGTVTKSEATFDNFANLGVLIGGLEGYIDASVKYLQKFNVESLGKLTVVAPFAPYIWTGPILERQDFIGWHDHEGDIRSFQLDQFLLGFRSIDEGGWLTKSASSSILSPLYLVVNVLMSELQLDIKALQDAIKSFVDSVKSAESDYNNFLRQWAQLANSSYMEQVSNSEMWKGVVGTLVVITILPLCILLLTLLLFKHWINTVDLVSGTPPLGKCRKFLTIFTAIFFILYASLLLILAGSGLMAMKILRGGCDVAQDVLDKRLSPEGLLNIFEGPYADVCLMNHGSGNPAELLNLTDALSRIDDLLRPPAKYGTRTTKLLTIPDDFGSVVSDEFSTLVMPKFRKDVPFLSNTTIRVWWSGLQSNTVSIDCSRKAIAAWGYHCAALRAEYEAANKAAPTLKWISEAEGVIVPDDESDQVTIYGTLDFTTALEDMFRNTRCGKVNICIANDPGCRWRSPTMILDHYRFAYIEPSWLSDVEGNWDTIIDKVPKEDYLKALFQCIAEANRQTDFLVGLRVGILKSLALGRLIRDPKSYHNDQTIDADGFPGWFDVSALGRRLPVFYVLESDNDLARLTFLDYKTFREWAGRNGLAVIQMLETAELTSLTTILSLAATRLNPIYVMAKLVNTFNLQFNCQALGEMTRSFADLVCAQTGPSVTNLFIIWSLVAFWNLLIFGMLLHFGLRRFPIRRTEHRD